MSARLRSQDHARETLVMGRRWRRILVIAVGTGPALMVTPFSVGAEPKPMTAIPQGEPSNVDEPASSGPLASMRRPLSP